MIVCFDDFNPFKNVRSDIDEDQHFLCQQIKIQCALERNIGVNFVYVWDVLEMLPQLTRDNVNIIVFNFTFNDRSAENKMNINFFSQDQVLLIITVQ